MNYRKLNICFVAQNAFGALTGVDTGHIGGIEQRQSFTAKQLAARGHKVSMITLDEGNNSFNTVEGVHIFRMCTRNAGIKGFRFFYPKWASLCKAMRRANADIYCYSCGDLGLGQVVRWCRQNGRKCVYMVASDPDCDPELPVLKPLRERIFYRYGLKHVDFIVAQTQQQQQKLREGFRVESTVITSPGEDMGDNEFTCLDRSNHESPRVLWVGRISKEKRFEWFLEVVEQCPDISFDVVGTPNANSEYAKELLNRADELPNIKIHGRILHQEMKKVYCRSRVLCCTSEYEGFPNTFKEAWSLGIPVVSTFDPDSVITTYGLGFVARSVTGMASCLREVVQSYETWLRISSEVKNYYQAYHDPEKCLFKLECFLLNAVGDSYPED